MEQMKFYSHEEMLDAVIGEKGTVRRNKHDEDINTFLVGEAIKDACISKNLTQEQLGEMIGVKRAQISNIESGRNLTLSTISLVFRALGIAVSFDMGEIGSVAL